MRAPKAKLLLCVGKQTEGIDHNVLNLHGRCLDYLGWHQHLCTFIFFSKSYEVDFVDILDLKLFKRSASASIY